MIVTILLLTILCLYGIRIGKRMAYEGYISKSRTDSIKGIFILIVFLSHIKNYIVSAGYVYHGLLDGLFCSFISTIGQLMVVMFLFYSGYGIMESIKRKGDAYINSIPRHRILNTFINFDIAVCIFLIVDLLLGIEVSTKQFLFSLITWDSVGNSNWYIFAIILCYFFTWIVTRLVREKILIWGGHFLLITLCALTLYYLRDPWWYNTLWAYPAGLFYSTYKKNIESVVDKHYACVFIFLSLICVIIYIAPFTAHGFKTNLLSVFFAFLIVVITMRIKVYNRLLEWCGEQLFPLYIYQRIPMLIIATLIPSFVSGYPLFYILVSLILTILLTYCYRFIKVSL